MTSKIFNLKNLIWFCAIGLATFSGYYSVFGISKLFSGGSWSILGMAAMLELSKLVVVTFLHDHFKTLKLLFKGYLVSAAIILMVITSIGVYGYLTNSYQETAKIMYKAHNEITLLDQKKELFIQQKTQIDKLVEEKNGRLKSLDNIRASQQNAYTQQLTQKRGTGGLSRSISTVDKTSENLNTEISILTTKSFALSDSIAKIDATKQTVSNETFSSELGPLLYLSRITGIPMDNVANWFILILVSVFDPLAISLVIAANHLSGKEKQKKILDELTENGQETDMYGGESENIPVVDEMIQEIIEPNSRMDLLIQEAETELRDIVEQPYVDEITIKTKKKRLNTKKKISILDTNKEQRNFYDETNQEKNKEEVEQQVKKEIQKSDFDNPWISKKPFRR